MIKLVPWFYSFLHGAAFVVVFALAYLIMRGGAWSTLTLGGIATWVLKWLEVKYNISAPAGQ
jgi:hypothetical protein